MRKLLSTVLVFFTIHYAFAQILSPNVVKHGGIDYDRLSQIDNLLKKYIDNNWLAGAVVIIVKDNQVAYHKGHGYANISAKNQCPLMLFSELRVRPKQLQVWQ